MDPEEKRVRLSGHLPPAGLTAFPDHTVSYGLKPTADLPYEGKLVPGGEQSGGRMPLLSPLSIYSIPPSSSLAGPR